MTHPRTREAAAEYHRRDMLTEAVHDDLMAGALRANRKRGRPHDGSSTWRIAGIHFTGRCLTRQLAGASRRRLTAPFVAVAASIRRMAAH